MECVFPFLAVLFALFLMVAFGYIAYEQGKAWKRALRTIADGNGLRFDEGSLFERPSAEGLVDGMQVIVDSYTQSHGKSSSTWTRIRVTTPETDTLSLSSEGMLSAINKALGGSDIQIGEAGFDSTVVVHSRDRIDAQSRLDGPARRAVGRAIGAGARLGNGTWLLRARGRVTDADRLEGLLRRVLTAATAVRHPGTTTEERLLRNAREEASAKLRARNLEMLVERGSAGPALLASFAHEGPPEQRLVAARALRSIPALTALLEVPDQALEAAIALAALAPDDVAPVQRVLVDHLGRDEPDLRAIAALGDIGDVSAVEPLLAHTDALVPGKLVKQAKQAISAIQARQVGAEAGQVSLADPQGGELSLSKEPIEEDTERQRVKPRQRE